MRPPYAFEATYIQKSGLFDLQYYLSSARLSSETRILDAIEHYLHNGFLSDISPSPDFNHREYRESSAYLANQALRPFTHFVMLGRGGESRALPESNQIDRIVQPCQRKILYVSHNASLTGAPTVLLNVIRYNASRGLHGVVLVGIDNASVDGILLDRFAEHSPVFTYGGMQNTADGISEIINIYSNIDTVYCNSVASAPLLQLVLNLPFPRRPRIVSHIHELQNVQKHFWAESRFVLENSDIVIAVSQQVLSACRDNQGRNRPRYSIIPPFIDPGPTSVCLDEGTKHPIPPIPTIYGCGTIEHRKGFDLFCKTISTLRQITSFQFKACWIGGSAIQDDPLKLLNDYDISDIVSMPGRINNPQHLYLPGDIFLMCSREDPFPLVCLEASSRGLPIVCYDERAGGIAQYVRKNACGLVSEYCNTDDSAKCLSILLEDVGIRSLQGGNGISAVKETYTLDVAGSKIFELLTTAEDSRSSLEQQPATHKVCVVSFGPPPLPFISSVEGGGLRCWGLAKAIKTSAVDWDVTFLFPTHYVNASDPNVNESYDGVKLDTFGSQKECLDKLFNATVIVVSYCYGSDSMAIADYLRSDQKLIFDCYVPIHVEVCARRSTDRIGELKSYVRDSAIWNHVIKRGDLLLCASKEQRLYYLGLLAAVQSYDPVSYERADNIVIAPFGIDSAVSHIQHFSDQALNSSGEPPIYRLLWFGGVYPWFDLGVLFEAIKLANRDVPCRLDVVGIKNPFNHHPHFLATAQRLTDMAQRDDFAEIISLHDWVPYQQRFDFYQRCDLAVCVNSLGIENEFAWRTRLLDYVQSETYFATNGGDPLSEELIGIGLAYRLDTQTPASMAEGLISALAMKRATGSLGLRRDAYLQLRESLEWTSIGNVIVSRIRSLR